MADCVWRTLCEHNHMFTDKNCNGCEHKETHWQYIWATRKKGWKAMENRCVWTKGEKAHDRWEIVGRILHH